MSLSNFVSEYWLVISGIISFIFACGYTYSSFQETKKNREIDNKFHTEQREQDMKEFDAKLKEQKKDHDEKFIVLFERMAKAEEKVDAVKDETMKSMQAIQLDIREIMTILKRKKK